MIVIASEKNELNKRHILSSTSVPSSSLQYRAYVKVMANVNDLEVGLTSDCDEVLWTLDNFSNQILDITKLDTEKRKSIKCKKIDIPMNEECLFEWDLQLVNEYDNSTRIFKLKINGVSVIHNEFMFTNDISNNMTTTTLDDYVFEGCNVRPFVSFQLSSLEVLKLDIGIGKIK